MADGTGAGAARISVVVPTFDRAETLVATLSCLAAQARPDVEVVVADDGSVDGTGEVVAGFAEDCNMPLLRYDWAENAGPAAARNRGAALATGEFVAFLDTGDLPRPGWLDAFDRLLEPGRRVACCGAVLAAGGLPTGIVVPRRQRFPAGWLQVAQLTGLWAVQRELFLRLGGFDPALRYSEVTEFWWRLAEVLVREPDPCAFTTELLVVRTMPERVAGGPRSRSFSVRRRLETAEHILDRHGPMLRANPHLLRTYRRVAAVAATRAGEVDRARRHYWRSARETGDAMSLARAAAVSVPWLRARLWGSDPSTPGPEGSQ